MVVALPFSLWGQRFFGQYWADAVLRLGPTALFLWTFLSSLLCLVFGKGILKGRNWARMMSLAYCLAAILVTGVLYKGHPLLWPNLILNLGFTAVMGYFLFRPSSNAFFEKDGA